MRAQASCRSLGLMLSRAMARSMDVSESVATCAQPKLSPVVACGHNWSGEAYLVAEPAAAAVNHDTDLADLVDAHLGGGPRVENLVNHL